MTYVRQKWNFYHGNKQLQVLKHKVILAFLSLRAGREDFLLTD